MATHQSLVLGFFIAIGLVVGVCEERFEVTSAQQLIKLLNISEANNFDANIVLLDDLDFSDSALTLPFGASSDGSCVSYTGVFEGNGHTIKGLVMNNMDNQDCPAAGLFCMLENAIFENLVIDSSCSFVGISVGALSVSSTGSLNVTNVTNKADVHGENGVGGFVGAINGFNNEIEMTFKDCVNDGNITGSGYIGGFVGGIINTLNLMMTISNCTNNGNCTILSDSRYVGGFVGAISQCSNMTINIYSIVNNGAITGGSNVGGFVGHLSVGTNMTMIISNSMNTGEISGKSSAGGFVSSISTGSGAESVLFGIINSVNKGSVSAEAYACGMFHIEYNTDLDVLTAIHNSINKGSVSAETYAYGIANTVRAANNVVSMGEIAASSDSFTFWESSTDVDLFFGLDGKCVNCTENTTLFVHNTNTGFYEVGSGEHVHDLLNAEVEKQNYGIFWTKELDLVDQLVEPSPSPSPLPSPSLFSPSPSSQSGGLSGGNKHGVSLFWIGVVVALAAHVAMAQ